MAVLVTHTALFVEVLFQCMPIDTQWNPQPGGQCHSAEIILISSGVINMVGDIIVLTLPIKRVWSLNISRGQKIAISTLFLMGLFVSVTSVFRILALKSEFSSDFTWTGVRGAIWTTVEVQTGFICANLPHCRPLVLRLVGIQVKVQQSGSARMVPPLTAPRSRHRVTFNGTGFKRMTDGSKEGVHVTDTDVDWNALEPDSSVALQGITVQTEIMQSVERMSGKSSEEVAFAPKTTIEHCR
ncbi:hypothetical protein MMC14_003694 [Varicellaria rhodocarpa]|nr:hypothetical protein [Varicellaria rhodocarpa]